MSTPSEALRVKLVFVRERRSDHDQSILLEVKAEDRQKFGERLTDLLTMIEQQSGWFTIESADDSESYEPVLVTVRISGGQKKFIELFQQNGQGFRETSSMVNTPQP